MWCFLIAILQRKPQECIARIQTTALQAYTQVKLPRMTIQIVFSKNMKWWGALHTYTQCIASIHKRNCTCMMLGVVIFVGEWCLIFLLFSHTSEKIPATKNRSKPPLHTVQVKHSKKKSALQGKISEFLVYFFRNWTTLLQSYLQCTREEMDRSSLRNFLSMHGNCTPRPTNCSTSRQEIWSIFHLTANLCHEQQQQPSAAEQGAPVPWGRWIRLP